MKAILVDDEPDGIRTLKKMLEVHCPQITIVATCSSAQQAKEKITELASGRSFSRHSDAWQKRSGAIDRIACTKISK